MNASHSDEVASMDVEGRRVQSSVRERLFRTPAAPVRVGRFVILRRLGAGGMGVVYSAYDTELDRKIAIKLLRRESIELGASDSSADIRMLREAQAMAKLSHPNVVQIYEVGRHGAQVFLAMEFVDGQNLADWLAKRADATSWREVVRIFIAAGRGLAAAHRAGLVHRDFKPANVLVDARGRVCVTDFGTVRLSEDTLERPPLLLDGEGEMAASSSTLGVGLTATGAMVGTVAYMSPEQIAGRAVSPRSDQFSFFVSLHEALFGERPFGGATIDELLHNLAEGRVRRGLAHRRVPAWLRAIVRRGLSIEAGERFADMDEAVWRLEAGSARRRRALGGSLAVLGVASVVAGLGLAQPLCPEPTDFAELWGAQAKAKLAGVFVTSKLPFGATAWAATERGVDRFAAAWRDESVAACEATHITGSQSSALLDRRYACLQRQRREVQALIERLGEGEVEDIEHAARVVADLPQPSMCADARSLLDGVAAPNPSQRMAVEQVGELLDRGAVLTRLGQPRAALDLIDEAVAIATSSQYRPSRAEGLFRRGQGLAALGNSQPAVESLQEAVDIAEGERHDRLAADAWIELSTVFAQGERTPDAAASALRRAAAATKRVGVTERQQSKLHRVAAEIALLRGDLVAAEREARAAVRSSEQALTPGQSPLPHSDALNRLAHVLTEAGRRDEARAVHERVLDLRVGELGRDHPEVAKTRANLGFVLGVRMGELEAAQEQFLEALRIFERSVGPRTRPVAKVHQMMAEARRLGGDLDGALEHAGLSVAIFRELDEERAQLVDPLGTLAAVHVVREAFEPAAKLYREILELQREAGLDDGIDYANDLGNLGACLVGLGQYDEARVHLDEAVARLVAFGPDDEGLAYPLRSLGDLHLARQQSELAVEVLDRALTIWQRFPDVDELEAAHVRWRLAEALAATGREQQRAVELADSARIIFLAREVPTLVSQVDAFLNAHRG